MKRAHGQAHGGSTKRHKFQPTVEDIVADDLTPIANSYWAPGNDDLKEFDPQVIEDIYNENIAGKRLAELQSRLVVLELSSYLENYLWKYFDSATASHAHVMSILYLVNQKFKEDLLNIWEPFHQREEMFVPFFEKVLTLVDSQLSLPELNTYLMFFIHAFQSLEDPVIRQCCLRLTSLPLWQSLSPGMLRLQMQRFKELRPLWKKFQKQLRKKKAKAKKLKVAAVFLPKLINIFYEILDSIAESPKMFDLETRAKVRFCERFLEFNIDLLSQLPTRRFYYAAFLDSQMITHCHLSPLNQGYLKTIGDGSQTATIMGMGSGKEGKKANSMMNYDDDDDDDDLEETPAGRLFNTLIGTLKYYEGFEIDGHTGQALTDHDMTKAHYTRLSNLQRLGFNRYSDQLRDLIMQAIGSIDTREALETHFSKLSMETLRDIAERLNLIMAPEQAGGDRMQVDDKKKQSSDDEVKAGAFKPIYTKDFMLEILIAHHERRVSQKQLVQEMPIFPSETLLWDEFQVPSQNYTGNSCLALPKLNLQFLTFHDYLLRNFKLFRLESTYEIREDLAKAVSRLRPRLANNLQDTIFTGNARFAIPVYKFAVTQIRKPKLGETKPSQVRAEVSVDLSPFRGQVRQEWEELREHDVMFLLTVRATRKMSSSTQDELLSKLGNIGRDGRKAKSWEKLNQYNLGIVYVRGCTIQHVLDEENKIIGLRDKKSGRVHQAVGNMRTFRIFLDPAQYQRDMEEIITTECEDMYTTFNLLIRRKAKENNFKAVLETIRDLMQQHESSVPQWLHDVFLGYGQADAAQYYNMNTQLARVRFRDTFLDVEHLKESFLNEPELETNPQQPDLKLDDQTQRSFELEMPTGETPDYDQLAKLLWKKSADADGDKKMKDDDHDDDSDKTNNDQESSSQTARLVARPYQPIVPRASTVKKNTVRFTPVQVEAIKSGLNPGLTMIVGPPGTGKTDTAVQIMSELYHNFPEQRTLLVTHSNHALNDLFEKIMVRDIPERYLLRLGRGSEGIESESDFGKFGRVNYMLARRIALLEDVTKLAKSLDMDDDVSYSCEAAGHFNLMHITARWEEFTLKLRKSADEKKKSNGKEETSGGDENKEGPIDLEKLSGGDVKLIAEAFPFTKYFSENVEQQPDVLRDAKEGSTEEKSASSSSSSSSSTASDLFQGRDWVEDIRIAKSCYSALQLIFKRLEETRPFELLRTYKDRAQYLLTKHAKIIAMTCTHAAIKRGDFVLNDFQYDNIIMEEAAQVLEIETFIPMLLQKDDPEFGSRLKRVILLGDHHQLPPVIKNRAFQKYSHMDQSLFTRFVRLGMPYIQLNAQGRCRPNIAKLWNWRYKNLGNLPAVVSRPQFQRGNPGFAHDFQLINVEDYNGVGESSPQPYFYQNLGEAEYIVQTYMYMRLLGYPAEKISIITSYNGQKALIKDVIEQRCAKNPLFGKPAKISTVDKFQGQQNDYILLSLVKTRNAGHIRDVRRLVVAMSRARLGLYVFARQSLFANCYELTATFNELLQKPSKLVLAPNEKMDAKFSRAVDAEPENMVVVEDVVQMGQLVHHMTQTAHAQYEEYLKTVAEFERKQQEEWQKRQAKKREIEEQMAAIARSEGQQMANLEKDQAYAEMQEKMDQEIGIKDDDQSTNNDPDDNDTAEPMDQDA